MEATLVDDKARFEADWPKVLFQLHVYILLLYSLYFLPQAKFLTLAFAVVIILASLLGTTAGSHRLWAHRSYTASLPLRIFLMICQTLSVSGSIYDWVLDHRIHHKFHGTNNDPYNYRRGFIFSHFGGRISPTNPNRPELERQIDMSDLEQDKVVIFQKKFYWILTIIANFLPMAISIEYWGEDMLISLMVLVFFRFPSSFHGSLLVNSGRSLWALEPNDRFFSESNLVFLIHKSHWHEYHYNAPWDCLTGEFGSYNCGCTTALLKIWTVMGLASDLKTIDSKGVTMALERAADTGKSIGECLAEIRDDNQLYEQKENFSIL